MALQAAWIASSRPRPPIPPKLVGVWRIALTAGCSCRTSRSARWTIRLRTVPRTNGRGRLPGLFLRMPTCGSNSNFSRLRSDCMRRSRRGASASNASISSRVSREEELIPLARTRRQAEWRTTPVLSFSNRVGIRQSRLIGTHQQAQSRLLDGRHRAGVAAALISAASPTRPARSLRAAAHPLPDPAPISGPGGSDEP